MNYEQEIKELLFEAGNDGLSIKKIARHIFNMHNGLFESVPYEKVYKDIQACVAKNNKSTQPFMERTERWGYYRLTKKSKKNQQLMLQFKEEEDKDNGDTPKNDIDLSLSLFDI